MQQKWNQNFDGEPMTDIPQKFLNAGCDVYMVMQLRHDEKILDERFASMRELNRRGKTPDPEHYEVTYYADLPAMWQDVPDNEVLEELFQMFNLSRPQDFEGHSMDAHVADKLLRDGRVRLKDCKSAKGKTYNATVLLGTEPDGRSKFSLEFEGGC